MSMDETLERALRMLLPEAAPQLLRDFAALWLRRRGARPMPAMDDLDPLEMPWALDSIFVLRRRPDGRFAYHLVGEGVTARLGGSLKGKTAFDVFEPDYAAWTEARWRRAAAERQCCYVHTDHRTADGVPLHAERLMMPLAGPGDTVDDLVGVAAFREWTGDRPPGGTGTALRRTIWTPVDRLPRLGDAVG